jgi:hypothetical protein
MKPIPGLTFAPEDFMYDEDSQGLLEGMEGASVQEKLVDTDFFNRFEVSRASRSMKASGRACYLLWGIQVFNPGSGSWSAHVHSVVQLLEQRVPRLPSSKLLQWRC